MLSVKQLQYFDACAQNSSFSRAAELLYTTQSNVSKVIKTMEDEMGETLFKRYAKGIGLTPAGIQVQKRIRRILEELEALERSDAAVDKPRLLASCNPSSWFADRFVEFYKERGDALHYQVYTADTQEIVERVRARGDDLGFVYVMENQLASFLYFLSRNYMEFQELLKTELKIYSGGRRKKNEDEEACLNGLKLVQRFPDEFSPDNYRNLVEADGHSVVDAETVVTTNSDYIMERLLKTGELSNISGAYLTGKHPGSSRELRTVPGDGNRLIFGCIRRKGEELPACAEEFLGFLRQKLNQEE